MAKKSKKVLSVVIDFETESVRKVKVNRKRGRPSFETSGRIRRKFYNRYSKEWERLNSLYQGNISGKLTFDEFMFEYIYTKKQDMLANKPKTSISNFTQRQTLTTKNQSMTAADNFNKHMDAIRAKIENNVELTPFEKDIMLAFGNDRLTARDVRSRSAKYQAAYNIAREHDVGKESFGS